MGGLCRCAAIVVWAALFGLIFERAIRAQAAQVQSTPIQVTPVREADAKCAKCHAEIFRRYLSTPMANASGAANEKLHVGTFLHKASGTQYEIAMKDGGAELSYHDGGQSGSTERRTLSYFLGSGHLGTTYLYSIGDYLFESPVAWYASSNSYDMKPGLTEMRQSPPPLPMESSCLRCHMSAVQPSDAGTMNRFSGPAFLHGGITCEACHGDSAQHVASRGKAAIVNPAHLDAARRDSVCISCHLEGDVSVERAARAALNYKPGEPISNYLAFYVRTGANLTARGVSEVEQLSQSTCKRTSGDKMSCTSCHDPHFTPAPEQRVAFYRGKCLACHAEPSFAKTHHPENQDCTGCHMPRAGAANILHVAWTDHRILRVPEPMKHEPAAAGKEHLEAIFSPGATERDLAMASYQLLLEGDREFEADAWNRLKAQGERIANDAPALDAWGNLSAERGDGQAAEQAFRRVLELEPNDLTALSNLGTLLAKQGKLKEAIPLLELAFDRNEDVPGLAMNLARVEWMAGDKEAARKTLNRALVYAPDLEDLRRLLTEIESSSAGGR